MYSPNLISARIWKDKLHLLKSLNRFELYANKNKLCDSMVFDRNIQILYRIPMIPIFRTENALFYSEDSSELLQNLNTDYNVSL